MSVSRRTLPVVACALLLGACRDAKITSYRVPREADPAPVAQTATPAAPAGAAGAAMASTPVATTAGMALTWKAPANWQSKPATSMRKATYTIAGDGAEAELAITAFPGDVGGELANVNRWRGQLKLPELTADELAKAGVPRAVHAPDEPHGDAPDGDVARRLMPGEGDADAQCAEPRDGHRHGQRPMQRANQRVPDPQAAGRGHFCSTSVTVSNVFGLKYDSRFLPLASKPYTS